MVQIYGNLWSLALKRWKEIVNANNAIKILHVHMQETNIQTIG